MKLTDLCRIAGITYEYEETNPEIRSVVADSKKVTPGSMYLCIRGLHTDGHLYVGEAIEKGANCIVALKEAEILPVGDVPVVRVEDTRIAAARLCNAFFGLPGDSLKMIGVTGTNGKTTISRLLREILESAGHPTGIIGTVGAESAGRSLNWGDPESLANMTTPDPWVLYPLLAQMLADGMEYVVMEVSSHALSLGKVEPIHFVAGVFTNLTPEHLDFHGSMESYAAAKSMLFKACQISILNLDFPAHTIMANAASGRVVTCSTTEENADYTANQVQFLEHGVRYQMNMGKEGVEVVCPIPGIFTVSNTLLAGACAIELGIDPKTVLLALSHSVGVKGRMERVDLGEKATFSVYIDYAHTPDALENLLLSARHIPHRGRLMLLFGCGGDRDKTKRPVMGKIAAKYADYIILTSDNARSEEPMSIIEQILPGLLGSSFRIIPNREQAIREAVFEAKEGDLILLAGKGHEEYEIIRQKKRPFSERDIVRRAFSERRDKDHEN